MKIFTKKCILQKTIIAVLMVLCINFIVPTYSHANFGGVLASPFIDFFCSMGDVIINLLQKTMTGKWGSSGATNMSLSAFLMESGEYYSNKYEPGDPSNATKVNPDEDFDKGWLGLKNDYYIPVATYSPEQIFSGNVSGLDINFINPNFKDGSASKLQDTISNWYIALRNLAVVGLMCVLVYVGIRILLSSTAGDKAKYKQMFTDWLIALCLLFFLHYIMSFVLTLTESIVQAINQGGEYSVSITDESAGKTFATNLLGSARFYTQYKDFGQKVTYFIFYIALVAYTAVFTWHYLKRLIMMAFLTIIAPMVALTYPIDKIGDGKAQAFNMWLKEYIYNALIQPFHLIIYTVFVGSAMDLAQTNMLYALACMGFILPAEKILKKMFGFDKAPLGTMGALTGFTAGSLMSKLGGKGGSGGAKGGNAGSKETSENKPPKYQRHHGTDGIDRSQNNGLDMGQESNKEENPEDKEANNNDLNTRARAEFAEQEEDLTRSGVDTKRLDPESERQLEEQRIQMNNSQEQSKQPNQEQNIDKDIKEPGRIRQGMRNVVSAHGGGKRIALKGAKTLGRAAKFTARTAFAATGTLAGAAAGLASGKGLAGVLAGATAGKAMGSRLGRTVSELPENAYNTASRIGKGAMSTIRTTADTFNGNTNLADKAKTKAFMKDAATEQYIRDKWTKEHEGKAPSRADIKKELEEMKPYANEGLTDAAAIYRARKAEKFGVSAEQSAKIAALAKDRNITSDVLGDEKKFNQRKEDFTQEFIDKGFSDKEAAKQADYVLNVMKAQVGQRHNLKQGTTSTTNTNNSGTRTNPRTVTNNTKPNSNTKPRTANNIKPSSSTKPRTTNNTNSNTKPKTTKGNNTKK